MTSTPGAADLGDAELPVRVLRLFEKGERGTPEDIADLVAMDSWEYRGLIVESLLDGDPDDWVAFMTGAARVKTYRALYELGRGLTQEAERARTNLGPRQRSARLGQIRALRDQIHRWVELKKSFSSIEHQAHLEKADLEKVKRRAEQDSLFGEAAMLLAAAIQRHRYAAANSGLEPEPADRELWAVLDRVQVPSTRFGQQPIGRALTGKNWLARLNEYLAASEVAA